MPGWNFADVWEVIAEQIPDAPAQVHGDRRVTWAEFDRRADGVAAALLDGGAVEQDKVAQYLYNGPEYIQSLYAAFKAGLFHLAEAHPQVQLTPTWIDNVQRVMPKGEVVPVPILCSVTFGAPLQLAPGEDKHAFLDRARAAVIALREVAA